MLCGRQSEAGQDLFVIAMTQGRRQGTFLEIGCNDEYRCSNTWLLEKLLCWTGVSMDLPGGDGYQHMWQMHRPGSRLIEADATQFDYQVLPAYFDYLQIDIAPPSHNLQVLDRVLQTQEFAVITYEHDAWDHSGEAEHARTQGRTRLQQAGYVLISGDIALPVHRRPDPDHVIYFEDWWANPRYVAADVIDRYRCENQSHAPHGIQFYSVLFEQDEAT
jgi:hypothetical protein